MDRTDQKDSTHITRGDSRPVRWEIIDRFGEIAWGQYDSAFEAAEAARRLWPDQEQDEDRAGKGWDVQVAGCE